MMKLALASSLGLASAATIQLPLYNSFNTEYYSYVYVGGQKVHMQFDAGSADVFVASTLCDSCGNAEKYDPSESSSSALVGGDFALQFVQWGSVNGTLYNDTLGVTDDVSLEATTLAAVTGYEGMLNVTEFAGKVGLGMPSASRSGAPTFLERLADAGALDANAWVARYPSEQIPAGKTTQAGGIEFGAYDENEFEVYFPIQADAGMYVMDGDVLSFGETTLVEGDDLVGVIVDTGTPGMLFSVDAADAANAELGCENADWPNWTPQVCGWATTCDKVLAQGDLPDVTLDVGSYTFTVSADQYLVSFGEDKPHQCASMIQGTDLLGGNILVGDAFLREYLVAYDVDGWQMGFAPNSS